jgi:DNA-binding LacI/PurR family transcriptional regulator
MGQAAKVVAVVAGDTSKFGYAEALRGIEEAARLDGYLITITVVDGSSPTELDLLVSLAMSRQLAGVIVLKYDPAGAVAAERIGPSVPLVTLLGVRSSTTSQATIREGAAARAMVEHLLELGHETVHHVRVPPVRKEDARTSGWRRALAAANRVVPPPIDISWDPHDGVRIGQEIASRDDVTAVFCGNDESAMGVIAGLRSAGQRVPDDISVAGFDDHPLSDLWDPPLTTARQDFAELGRRGWALLMRQLDGDTTARSVQLAAPLIVRASTAPPGRSAP